MDWTPIVLGITNITLTTVIGGVGVKALWKNVERLSSIRDHLARINGSVATFNQWKSDHIDTEKSQQEIAENRHARQHEINNGINDRIFSLDKSLSTCQALHRKTNGGGLL